MDTYTLLRGKAPLLVSLPHDGAELPNALVPRLTAAARGVPDTDWQVSRLYAFARDLGASIIVPRYSRYVVDLNRPPDDTSLYPGQNTTGLCPNRQFSGEPVYLAGEEPTRDEIIERIERYWRPYHAALADELERLREKHGRVALWEGHSIRSEVPFLFPGRLPDLNIGTADGASCSPWLESRIAAIAADQRDYTWVLNGRFKGGYITRHYGAPKRGIDALQLELAQSTYMDETRSAWDEARAVQLQKLLQRMLEAAAA